MMRRLSRLIGLLVIGWVCANCQVCEAVGSEALLDAYRERFKPVQVAGKDYWEFLYDTDILGRKEAGAIFHFDPDQDLLCREAGIITTNASRYTHVLSYQKRLRQNPDKAFVVNACAGDWYGGHYRSHYFSNSAICSLPQFKKASDFFESDPWTKIERLLGPRLLGFLYVECSWQVRGLGVNRVEPQAKRYGLELPTTVGEYYDFYGKLFKGIQQGTGAKDKLLVVAQFKSGYFLPLAFGAPAASYYVHAHQNISLKMAHARGAARQYGKPLLVYLSFFPVAGWVDHPIEIDIPYTIGDTFYSSNKDLLAKGRGGIIPASKEKRVHFGARYGFFVPQESHVAVTTGGFNVSFVGPLCGMAFSQHRRHLFFQYLGGAGMVVREESTAWGGYDPGPAKKRKKTYRFVKEGEPLCIDGYTDLNKMHRKHRRYVNMRIEQKDVYHSPLSLQRRELLQFAKGNNRGTAFAPVAYVIDPHWALFNTYYFLRGKEEDFSELERMVFNWRRWAFRGQPGTASRAPGLGSATKVSELNVGVRSYQHRREITDVLTTDASQDVLNTYPVVVTIGPNIRHVISKMKNFVNSGGTWVANVAQLKPEDWKDFLGVTLDSATVEGKSWENVLTGKKCDEPFGTYHYVKVHGPKQGLVLIRDQSGAPLAVEYSVGSGSAVLVLQQASLLHGKQCGSDWRKKRGMSLALFDVVDILADRCLPVKVEGNIQSLYNITPDGWLLTLMNDDGVEQPIGKPEVHNPKGAHEVVLRFPVTLQPSEAQRLAKGGRMPVETYSRSAVTIVSSGA